MRRLGTPLTAALTAVLLAGCSAAPAPTSPSPVPPPAAPSAAPAATPDPQIRDVATGLAAPWDVVFTADGTPLVSARDTGEVIELAADGSTRVVGTVPGVVHGGEGGLLGLAARGDDLFVYSTGSDGNRVERFPLTGSPGSLGLGGHATVLGGLPSARTHNGGRIAFGPDGMLYVTVGDAGVAARAQDPGSLAGKLLRMTPEGGVPADNPVPGSLVYSSGHRNPQGIGWAEDGSLFLAEFGQNTWDELNLVEPGGNYGWPEVEGIAGRSGFIDPLQQWPTDQASPSGLAIVDGRIHVANLRGERLRVIPVSDPTTSTEILTGEYGRLRTAVAAPDGTVWIVTNNTDGRGSPRPGDDRIVSIPLTRP